MIIEFLDASFAKTHDMSSQLGSVIFLGDETDTVVPLVFWSYKARRIKRSAISGECIAFGDMFAYAISIAQDLSLILC